MRYEALSHAKQSLELKPKWWWRAYHSIGCAYHPFNKYSKAFFNFDKALAIEPTNKGVKAARHESKFKLWIEKRSEHLDERSSPQTTEQLLEKNNKNGLRVRPEMFKKMDKIVDLMDNSEGDVVRGHRYYDGMTAFRQDYEMAAKYFGKAAKQPPKKFMDLPKILVSLRLNVL